MENEQFFSELLGTRISHNMVTKAVENPTYKDMVMKTGRKVT